MSITINLGGNWPTFANFHIHSQGFDGNNGAPSTPKSNFEGKRGDTGMADDVYSGSLNPRFHQAINVYVMSRYGLSMYDPTTRQSVQLVKGIGFLTGEECK